MSARFARWCALIFLGLSPLLYSVEPLFRTAVAGEVIAGPVLFNERTYLVTADYSVKCLSASGEIIWSAVLPGKPLPVLTVSRYGQVIAASGNGFLSSWNADGGFLWQQRNADAPLYSPLEGRDGRFFVVYRNRVEAISHIGLRKWTVSTTSPAAFPPAVSGDGDLLLYLSDATLLRLSPFGEILEYSTPPGTVTAVAPVATGYLLGLSDGRVLSMDVRRGRATEIVWDNPLGPSAVAALTVIERRVFSASADGTLSALTDIDGQMLWRVSTPLRPAPPLSAGQRPPLIISDYGQIILSTPEGAAGYTEQGAALWQFQIPRLFSNAALSSEGILVAGASDWTVAAWRVEDRIKSAKKNPHSAENYSILGGTSVEYGTVFMSNPQLTARFFERLKNLLDEGRLGPEEVQSGRRCVEILSGNSGTLQYGISFDSGEKARAASLLGQIGSLEFLDALYQAARSESDPTVTIGVLSALTAIALDSDGQLLDTVEMIIRRSGFRDQFLLAACCDALYAVARYNSGERARAASTLLLGLAAQAYPSAIKEYAMRKLHDLLR